MIYVYLFMIAINVIIGILNLKEKDYWVAAGNFIAAVCLSLFLLFSKE